MPDIAVTDASYDLIVIGAGINGAAIAREAALRGLRVLVVEQHDVAAGTSAASTRLIHGGLRYLEYAELSLVFESLHERERLLRHAPHLVAPIGMYLPVYAGASRKLWQIRAGMALYDLLSLGKSLPRHEMLDRDALRARLPGLEPDGLRGGAFYYDAQVAFPERLVIENLVDARDHGAEVETYTRATRVIVEAGRAQGVEVERGDGARAVRRASAVVNAAGPWVDRVVDGLAPNRLIGGTKGSHVIVPPFPGAPASAVYSEAQADGRPFFVLPWNGLYLIGTTDERFEGDPAAAAIDPGERDYLIAETERRFPAARGLGEHVLYTYAGVRPLPHVPRGKTGAITRRHIVHRHDGVAGLWSIIGGKLTTHRALGDDVLEALGPHFDGLSNKSSTRDRPLPGALGTADRDALRARVNARFGEACAARLWNIYGAHAERLLTACDENAALAGRIVDGSAVRVVELVHGIEHEWATSLEDLLQRRCMAGLDADFGVPLAAPAAERLVEIGVWDRAYAAEQVSAYLACAQRHDARSVIA